MDPIAYFVKSLWLSIAIVGVKNRKRDLKVISHQQYCLSDYVKIHDSYVVQTTPVWQSPLALLHSLNHIGKKGFYRFT